MSEKLLFVCNGNVNRSPTFVNYFKKYYPSYEVKSTGTHHGYPDRISEELLSWADRIYVMDLSQELFISKLFPAHLSKVRVVGISDQYQPDEDTLIELIDYWINTYEVDYKGKK